VATAATYGFERLSEDKIRPDAFFVVLGGWEVVEEDAAPGNHVLRQPGNLLSSGLALVTGTGRAYANGVAATRISIESGGDPTGGVVVRASDRKNLYVARLSAKDGAFRLVRVKDGAETELASATVPKPAPKSWHAIEVSFQGSQLVATLDEKTVVRATDATFAMGWCGLWTKGDSSVSFDDLKLAPSK
jgi:hypothetical protein